MADFSKVPLEGRTVLMGEQRTTTDGGGAFTFDSAPDVYDVTIMEADSSVVSVYLGLRRRDPVLVHGPVSEPIEPVPGGEGAAKSSSVPGEFPPARGPTGRLKGEVLVPRGHVLEELSWRFRFPGQPSWVPAGTQRRGVTSQGRPLRLDTEVPGSSRQDAVACLLADAGPTFAEECGIGRGSRVSLALQVPPELESPSEAELAHPSMKLSWSKLDDVVYGLTLYPLHDQNPYVHIYTSGTTITWPDLPALGIPWRKQPVRYELSLTAQGPFGSIDEAVGPRGLAAHIRKTAWVSTSSYRLTFSPVPPTRPAPPPALVDIPPRPERPSEPAVPSGLPAPAAVGEPRDPVRFARPARGAPAVASPLVPAGVIVGERWGCAQFAHSAGVAWQCWQAHPGDASGTPPQAWWAPWLPSDPRVSLRAGANRLCAQSAPPQLTVQCWHPPRRGDQTGRELPAIAQWSNPRHTTWNEIARLDRLTKTFVGGTFACLLSAPGDLWCRGEDDRFGQLGHRGPRAVDQPAYLHVWPASSVALGTWHGCALASRTGLSYGAFVACWGRGDFGQLGAPARDDCLVDGVNVPCARAPQEGPALYDGVATLGAGDLFTCVTDKTGIRCWGANRDGFFGVPGSCPESLRTAWPTLHGPVSAPRAACAPKPVRIPDIRYFEPNFQVAPRALCFSGPGSPWRCIGGLPKPRGAAVKWAIPSPGADASACTVGPKGVLCWGEAYSPPQASGRLVPIALDRSAPPTPEMAVLDPPGLEKWDKRCLVHRGCRAFPVVVPPCGPTVHAREWSDLLSSGEARLGEIVQVRGRLGVGPIAPRSRVLPRDASAAIGGRTCDGRVEGPVVLDGSPHVLRLEGLACGGDESRQCCNAPAFGQEVVATGRLELQLGTGSDPQWTLAAVKLCSEGPP